MPKTANNKQAIPKNIQIAFITTATIAFVVNAVYWILLLLRVYPEGMRFSQFSVWAISIIVFPALMFAVAHMITSAKTSRLEHLFKASLLALVGLFMQLWVVLIDQFIVSPHLPYGDATFANLRVLAPSLVALAVFAGYLLIIKRREKNAQESRTLRISVLLIAGISLVASAIPNIHYAVSQFMNNQNIFDLLTHPAAITSPVLPIIFLSIAYYAIRKDTRTLNRLFTATVYTLIGVMIAATTALLYMIGVWTLAIFNTYPDAQLFDIQTAFVVCVSLLIYAHLIIIHSRARRSLKQSAV